MTLLNSSRREHAIRDGVAVLKRLGDSASVYLPGVGQPVGPVNLLTYSRDITFGGYNTIGSATRTNNFSTVEDGGVGGCRIQTVATADGVRRYAASPPGYLTFAVWVKSNTGASQPFALRIYDNITQTVSSNFSATTTWQLFVFTVNASSGGTNFQGDVWSTASQPAIDILIGSWGLFQGEYTAAQILSTGGIPLTTTAPAAAQYKSWITGASLNPSDTGLTGPANLLTYSQDFTNAVWSKVNSSVVGGFADPYGGTVANKITWTATNTQYVQESYSTVSGSVYTQAFIIQKNNCQWVQVGLYDTGNKSVYVDLNNGVLGAVDAGVTADIASMGGGWYLVRTSSTCALTGTSTVFVHGALGNSNNSSAINDAVNIYRVGLFAGTYTADQLLAFGGIPLTTASAGATGQNVSTATKTILGQNLLSNYGNPFININGWGGYQTSISVVSGELIATQTLNTGGTASLGVTLVPGATYKLTATYRNIDSANVSLLMQRGAAGSYANISGLMPLAGTSNTTNELTFVAPASDAQVAFTLGGTSVGQRAALVSVSVQQIITSPNALWSNSFADNVATTSATVDASVGFLTDGAGTVGPELGSPANWSAPSAGITTNTGTGVITFSGSEGAFTGVNVATPIVTGGTLRMIATVSVTSGQVFFGAGEITRRCRPLEPIPSSCPLQLPGRLRSFLVVRAVSLPGPSLTSASVKYLAATQPRPRARQSLCCAGGW